MIRSRRRSACARSTCSHPTGFSDGFIGCRHHAVGRRRVCRGNRRALPSALVGRAESPGRQNHYGNGRAACQDAGDGPQRDLDWPSGVQLIRRTMLQAAHAAELLPHQLSFTAALQTIAASWLTTLFLDDKVKAALFRATHLGIVSYRIGNRPDRVEPCAIKRRPKPHDLLTEPRAVARAKLLAASCSS